MERECGYLLPLPWTRIQTPSICLSEVPRTRLDSSQRWLSWGTRRYHYSETGRVAHIRSQLALEPSLFITLAPKDVPPEMCWSNIGPVSLAWFPSFKDRTLSCLFNQISANTGPQTFAWASRNATVDVHYSLFRLRPHITCCSTINRVSPLSIQKGGSRNKTQRPWLIYSPRPDA